MTSAFDSCYANLPLDQSAAYILGLFQRKTAFLALFSQNVGGRSVWCQLFVYILGLLKSSYLLLLCLLSPIYKECCEPATRWCNICPGRTQSSWSPSKAQQKMSKRWPLPLGHLLLVLSTSLTIVKWALHAMFQALYTSNKHSFRKRAIYWELKMVNLKYLQRQTASTGSVASRLLLYKLSLVTVITLTVTEQHLPRICHLQLLSSAWSSLILTLTMQGIFNMLKAGKALTGWLEQIFGTCVQSGSSGEEVGGGTNDRQPHR